VGNVLDNNSAYLTDSIYLSKIMGKKHGEVARIIRKLLVVDGDFSKEVHEFSQEYRGNNYSAYKLTTLASMIVLSSLTSDKARHLKRAIFSSMSSAIGLEHIKSLIEAIDNFEIPDDLCDLSVYAIRNEATGAIKLGISRNPEARLKQLQTGCDGILVLVAVKHAPQRFADEAILHEKYESKRIRGEWFLIDEECNDDFLGVSQ